jgi:signal transduction histidine kinase
LRQLLQVLGSTDTTVPLGPAPTVNDIDQLVERLRTAGHPVELEVEGQPRLLEPALSQAAYRVVQEALTNAVRYAAGASTRVVVVYGSDRLTLEVVDHGAQNGVPSVPGSGYGLRGLRERVAIFGGDFSATPAEAGGFAVRATLPLTPP